MTIFSGVGQEQKTIVEKFLESVSKILLVLAGGKRVYFCTHNYMYPIFIIAGSHEQMKEVELKSLEWENVCIFVLIIICTQFL